MRPKMPATPGLSNGTRTASLPDVRRSSGRGCRRRSRLVALPDLNREVVQLFPNRGAVLIALLSPLALPACGGAPKLDGAVYAAQIPVYPKARLRDVGGGNFCDDIGGPVTF